MLISEFAKISFGSIFREWTLAVYERSLRSKIYPSFDINDDHAYFRICQGMFDLSRNDRSSIISCPTAATLRIRDTSKHESGTALFRIGCH